MNKDLDKILLNKNADIDNQQLLDYLNSQLPKDKEHALENQMLHDNFMNDAVEGLQAINSSQKVETYRNHLHKKLQKEIKNKERRNNKTIGFQFWTIFGIVLILLLAVIGFLIIKKHLI